MLGYFAQSSNSLKLTFMKCNDFSMLIRHDTLWPWHLIRWPWKFVVDLVSRGHSLHYNWSKSNNPRLSYLQFGKFLFALRTSRCDDLDIRPLDLDLLWSFAHHVFKLCLKFEQNRAIHCRVIDDLANSPWNFSRGRVTTKGFQGCVYRTSSNLETTYSYHLCSFQISCFIFKRRGLKVEWRWKWRQISHFLTPCKN